MNDDLTPDTLFERGLPIRRAVLGEAFVDGALAGDKVADPTQRDDETVAVREAGRLVRDDETLSAVMIPLGDGLLAAVKRS